MGEGGKGERGMNGIRTCDLSDLFKSLEAYLEAKRDHDTARDQYEGYSWDYFGQAYRQRLNEAALTAETRLADFIDQRITKLLSTLPDNERTGRDEG